MQSSTHVGYPIHSVPASGTVKKVIEINPYLLGTMAGGAGE
jgi:20S proteasome alpha/beta subunit